MSYYGTPLRSKSEFECDECGCWRNDSYCWNCDEEAAKEVVVTSQQRAGETDGHDIVMSMRANEARAVAFEKWWRLSVHNGTLPRTREAIAREAYYAAWGGGTLSSGKQK